MITERQMTILLTLSKLEILTRTQIQVLHDTKSIRNTNHVMKRLKDYTSSIRLQENAYYLNKRGMELIGTDKQFKMSNQVEHKIMRNDAYIFFKPTEWIAEREFKIGSLAIQPDAFFYSGSSYKFLEVDNTQRWNINVGKMEMYKKMKDTGAFQKQYGKFPTIVWVTRFESRKKELQKLAKKLDIFTEVYHHDEIKR